MPVIKLTHNDLNEMVRRTVHSILRESVKEVQGSIMAEKEDVIQEIVDYVTRRWEQMKELNFEPQTTDRYTFDDKKGVKFSGEVKTYIILVPQKITRKLETSKEFQINIAVNDYTFPEGMAQYFTKNERGTEGTSYAGPEFNKFIKTSMKVSKSRIDMYVPSLEGELQVQGFYSTLYHELNHTASRVELQKKHKDLPDQELNGLQFFTASQRKGTPPHFTTQSTMHPENDPLGFLRDWGILSDDPEVEELKKKISFVFYAIWEITERNARAEAIYGDLKALNATRENFKEIYPQTELYHQIQDLNEFLDELENVRVPSKLWSYAGKVMGMNRRGKNACIDYQANVRYHEAIKQRFLSRSRELLDMMYRKGMKVAELYFQRKEDREKDTPGGGADRLSQMIGND